MESFCRGCLAFAVSSRCWHLLGAVRQRVVLTLNRTFKVRTGFNGDCLVDDVAFDAGSRRQANLQATHAANDTAIHNNIVSDDFAFDCGTFADGQQVGANVAFNLTFNLDIACCFQVTGDQQISCLLYTSDAADD